MREVVVCNRRDSKCVASFPTLHIVTGPGPEFDVESLEDAVDLSALFYRLRSELKADSLKAECEIVQRTYNKWGESRLSS